MFVVVYLGPQEEYLGLQGFLHEQEAEEHVDSLSELVLANIKKELPLNERLKLAPKYFPFAGRLQGLEVEEIR